MFEFEVGLRTYLCLYVCNLMKFVSEEEKCV